MSAETAIAIALFVGLLMGGGCAFLGIRFPRSSWPPLVGGLCVLVIFWIAIKALTFAVGGA